ncbi:hypothetical protein PybrP1_000887, partial [[Pythium] brassicae (nom. inval.)]
MEPQPKQQQQQPEGERSPMGPADAPEDALPPNAAAATKFEYKTLDYPNGFDEARGDARSLIMMIPDGTGPSVFALARTSMLAEPTGAGYTVVKNYQQLVDYKTKNDATGNLRVFGLFHKSHMSYEVGRVREQGGNQQNSAREPSLPEMAITLDESFAVVNDFLERSPNTAFSVVTVLSGHGNSVNELKFHPGAISRSYTEPRPAARPFDTKFVQFPAFCTSKVHAEYVDCVRMVGDLVLSKSRGHKVVLWKPNPSRGKDAVTVLREYQFKDAELWFMKFGLDSQLE